MKYSIGTSQPTPNLDGWGTLIRPWPTPFLSESSEYDSMVRTFPGIGGGDSTGGTDSDSGDDDTTDYEEANEGGTGSFGDRPDDSTDETESDPTDQPARGRDTETGGRTDSPTYDSDPDSDTDTPDDTGETTSPSDPLSNPTGATGDRPSGGDDDSSSPDSGSDRTTRTFPGSSDESVDGPVDPRPTTEDTTGQDTQETESIETPSVFDEPGRLDDEFNVQADTEEGFRSELRQEAAERYSQATVEELTFGAGDITLQETDEGFRPQLADGAQSDIEQYWQGEVTEQVEQRFARDPLQTQLNPTGQIDVQRTDLQFSDDGVRMDETLQREVQARSFTPEVGQVVLPEDVTAGGGLTEDAQTEISARRIDRQLPSINVTPEDVTREQPSRLNPTAPRGDEGFTLDLGAQQDLAATRLREQLTGREEVSEGDIAGIEATPSGGARAEFTDQFRREQAAEKINQDRTFLPMHDDVRFTASDVELMGDEATLSESGEEKVQDALAIDALNELEYETGADLEREDVNVAETGEGELEVTLSESGEEAIEIERMVGTDLPYVGGLFEEGVRLRRGFRETTEPVRETADDVIPGEQDFYKGAAVLAPVAVAEPTPVGELSTGALAGIGLGIGATATLSNRVVGEDPSASATATTSGVFAGDEMQVPEDGDVVRGSELGIPSGGEVAVEEPEIQPGETPLTGKGEIPAVGGDYLESSELPVPSAERTTDPRTLQTQLTEGLLREEEEDDATTPTIPAEDIYAPEPEPVDQPGPSNRERQRREDLDPFERTFPTGGGAVVGEGTERIEEAQQQEVAPGEGFEPSAGVETAFGGSGFPVTGGLERLEEAQEPTVGWDTVAAPLTRPAAREDVIAGPMSTPQEAADTQQDVAARQQTDLMNEVAQAQKATAEVTEETPGYEYPEGYGSPYVYGYPFGYGYETPPRQATLESSELPEPDDGREESSVLGRAEEGIFTQFRDPLGGSGSGDSQPNGGLFSGFEPTGNDPFGDPDEDNGPLPW